MKGKKSAFANTSTGYGKSHCQHNQNHNKTNNNNNDSNRESKKEKNPNGKVEDNKLQKLEQDNDLNSGFGDYLRTPEAVEMMKLFVFANTVMLIVTMAWPNIKEQYIMLMHWLAQFHEEYE